ncbi:MAG: citrate/2-methylcitrate synthase, partial [Myxococcota bacterium]
MDPRKKGLAGVIVGQTALSRVDGIQSELRYRGYNVDELIQGSFEETCFLLLYGRLPAAGRLQRFCEELASYRRVAADVLDFICRTARRDSPMAVLRTAVSMLSSSLLPCEHEGNRELDAAAIRMEKAKALIAKTATLVAAIGRARQDLPPLDSQPRLGHAANFFAMLQDS